MLRSLVLLRSLAPRYGVLALLPCCGRVCVKNFTTTNRSPLLAKDTKDKDQKDKDTNSTQKPKTEDGKQKSEKDPNNEEEDKNENEEEEPIGLRPIHPGKVRYGFIPEEWFTFFYETTGVTGPYVFGLGLMNFLFSKEWYVCEHEFYSGLSMAILSIVAVKKLGPPLAKYLDKEIDKVERHWKQVRLNEIKALQAQVDAERQEQAYAESSLLLLEMKKQNIDLQLEIANRKELMKIYDEVKHRLDYQVICGNIIHRINHKNMVLWLHKEVLKSLPYKDEATLEKCKADLSAMALRAKV